MQTRYSTPREARASAARVIRAAGYELAPVASDSWRISSGREIRICICGDSAGYFMFIVVE